MIKSKTTIKKSKFILFSIIFSIALAFVLPSCSNAAGGGTPESGGGSGGGGGTPTDDAELGKTQIIDFSGLGLWNATDEFNKATSTVTFKGEYGGVYVAFTPELSLKGYNYIEVDYTSNQIIGTIQAQYTDKKVAYTGLAFGSNKMYIKIDPEKSLSTLTITSGPHFPFVLKINSIKLIEKGPAYLTTPVEDKGNKTFHDSASAMDYVKNLSIGWNLGNSLEATYYGNRTAAESKGDYLGFTVASDAYWDVYPATKELFAEIKKAGFDMVRIPVTWNNHLIDDKYTIDPAWMTKVKQIVDWALEEGLYVMLNEHHSVNTGVPENAQYGDGYQVNKVSQTQSEAFLKAVWTQICAAFNNGYDEHLMFEVLNEPRNTSKTHQVYDEWDTGCHAFGEYGRSVNNGCEKCKEDCEVLNSYIQACVDTIRASGGNNSKRYLVIPALSTGIKQPMMPEFKMPNDSKATDKLILAVHDYYYCLPVEGQLKEEWNSYPVEDKYKQDEAESYSDLNGKFMSKGIPLILTETSCNYSNERGITIEGRQEWYDYLLDLLSQYNGRIMWWDNGGSVNSALINRETLKWECNTNVGNGKADTSAFVSHLTAKAAAIREEALKPVDPPADPTAPVDLLDTPVTIAYSEENSVLLSGKFENAKEGSAIKVVVTGNGQFRFVTESTWGWEGAYVDGTMVGAKPYLTEESKTGSYYGNMLFTDGGTVFYFPTAAAWTKIKTDGLRLVGQDLTVTDVVFLPTWDGVYEVTKDIPVESSEWSVRIDLTDIVSSSTSNSFIEVTMEGTEGGIKFIDSKWAGYAAGEITGDSTIDSDGNIYIGSVNPATIKYKPTADEWTTIKTEKSDENNYGLFIQCGSKVTSIKFHLF